MSGVRVWLLAIVLTNVGAGCSCLVEVHCFDEDGRRREDWERDGRCVRTDAGHPQDSGEDAQPADGDVGPHGGIDAGSDSGGKVDGGCTSACGPCETCMGGACVAMSDGEACTGGTCHSGACCTGCWNGTMCEMGRTTSACGRNGASCATCECASDTCTDGACAPLRGGVRQAALGRTEHQCAILLDASLWCWGGNSQGQLGLGDTVPRTRPVELLPGSSWADITAGQLHTCALVAETRDARCWGANDTGQLGTGDVMTRTMPTMVPTSGGEISAGAFTCIVRPLGSLECWGRAPLPSSPVSAPTRTGALD